MKNSKMLALSVFLLLLSFSVGCKKEKRQSTILIEKSEVVKSLDFSSDGQLLASAGGDTMNKRGRVEIWNVDTSAIQEELSMFSSNVIWLSFFNNNSQKIILATRHGGVSIASLERHNKPEFKEIIEESKYKFFQSSNTFALSKRDRYLAAGDYQGSLAMISLDGQDVPSSVDLSMTDKSWLSLSFSDDESLLAAISIDRQTQESFVQIYSTAEERFTHIISLGEQQLQTALFSSKDNSLYIISKQGDVKLWKYDESIVEHEFAFEEKGFVSSSALSSNGRFLAAGINQVHIGKSLEGKIEIWDVRNKKHLCTLNNLESTVGVNEQIEFSSEDNIVATTEGGAVKIFSIASCLAD